MADGQEQSFLGEMSRMVEAIENPPKPLSPLEKEQIRQRERALLVDDIKKEVLRELATRRGDRARYRRYLRGMVVCTWDAVLAAILRVFAPNRAIEHIEAHMFADTGTDKWKAYWRGRSGQRMQTQLRQLYRRTRRER